MMAGHARGIPIASEALAEEELEAQLGERFIDAWKVESGGRVTRQSVRSDQAP
jgi:hypothetical protein